MNTIKTNPIRITSADLGRKQWTVIEDKASFETLQAAIDYVKRKYAAKHIKVDQTGYVMAKMNASSIKKLTRGAELPNNDPVYQLLIKPSDVVAKAITKNKDVEFQFFVMTESEREKAAKAEVVPQQEKAN